MNLNVSFHSTISSPSHDVAEIFAKVEVPPLEEHRAEVRGGQVDVGLVVGDDGGRAVVEAEVDPRHRHLAHLLVERLEFGPLAPVQVNRGLLGLFLWDESFNFYVMYVC